MQRFFILLLFIGLGTTAIAQRVDPYVDARYIKHEIKNRALTPEQIAWVKASTERSDTFDILHYDIALDLLRFESSILAGDTRVDFRAKMNDLNKINLDLEGLEVSEVTDPLGNVLNYEHEGPLLTVFLDTTLNSGQEYSVRVKYEGTPITCPSGFGGFYFEDGYAYNLGIGLAASPHNFGRAWFPCFDNFVERSTYTYRLTAHNGRTPYGLGTLTEENNLGGDTIQRVFEMMQPIPTYLSHVAISNYEEVTYMLQGAYGAVPVRLIAKPADTSDLRRSFNVLGDVLDCLEYWFGPHPFEMIGFNITPRGAMEHPTGIAYPISSIDGGRTNLGLITHELAHHWWGNITTLSTEFDMWIKEGPASYTEQQIIEWIEGPEAFEQAIKANNVNMITTAHIADEGYWPLSPMPDAWTYGRTTYDKGAAMIHNLRSYLGDSLFRSGMQTVLEERAYESINARELRDELIQATGYDLTDFFDNWIFSPGWSDFYVSSFQTALSGSEVDVNVTIEQGLYATDQMHQNVPLKVAFVKNGEEPIIRDLLASDSVTEADFKLPFAPDFIFTNPDNHLNLASAGDLYWIDADFNDRLAFTNWRLQAEGVAERFPFQITHHFIAPEQAVPDTIPFRLSTRHFWSVEASDISGELSARVDYSGVRESDIDYELTSETEDSIILVYRPDGASPWLEYPYYTKQKILPNDGKGVMILDQILPGQYTFANGPSGIFVEAKNATLDLAVFPNPVTHEVVIDLTGIGITEEAKLQIINASGSIIQELKFPQGKEFFKLPVASMSPGNYWIILNTADKSYQAQIIKI